ncbi:NlpC/P60 family protein [Rhodocaloribacter litoris]|uniref:NlpC/P60 family protein n=1 Tax=Rhodocaloribacter litoris TaxID=2558931 RepID=UPI001E44CC6C|nr:NlpC/P60 family protein [Rhodocaloribacter litoris]
MPWLVLTVLVVGGCASSAPRTPLPADTTPLPAEVVEQRLRAEVATWIGTPHRWGGASRAGVDCSGLVHVLFGELFALRLPRTTEAQARTGTPVRPEALRAGDLVFFQIDKRTRHVGIYLCCGEFAHASSSLGVTISHLDEPYWQRAFRAARRVLPATTAPPPADRPPAPRPGW